MAEALIVVICGVIGIAVVVIFYSLLVQASRDDEKEDAGLKGGEGIGRGGNCVGLWRARGDNVDPGPRIP